MMVVALIVVLAKMVAGSCGGVSFGGCRDSGGQVMITVMVVGWLWW